MPVMRDPYFGGRPSVEPLRLSTVTEHHSHRDHHYYHRRRHHPLYSHRQAWHSLTKRGNDAQFDTRSLYSREQSYTSDDRDIKFVQ